MNILIFSWRDPKHPLAGGAEQVVHEHSKGWIKAGHSVTLFASRFEGSLEMEKIEGVKIIRKGYQYLGVQIAGFFYYLQNKDKFDLIIDQFHGLSFFTPLYISKPKIALIQETARNVWFLNSLPIPLNWIVGLIGFLGEPFIFLFYKNVPFATGSGSAKIDVSKFFIPLKNITVWPHGVLLDLPKEKIKKEEIPIVVFLGVLSKDKGIEDAIKCFSILEKNGKYNFWIIGKPETEEYGKKLDQLVKGYKLGDKVKFFGFVTQQKKFELLAKAHVLINPSSREGWGLVNIEANAVETPIVSYNASGLVDSVRDGVSGVIVDENTPESLAKTILDLIKNKDKYEKLQKGSLEWSKNFRWDKSIEISLNHLNSVAKKINPN